MNKLEQFKKRKEPSIKLEVDQTKEIEALNEVKESIDSLHKLINGQTEYDFDLLAKQLVIIGDKLDLDENFKALTEEIRLLPATKAVFPDKALEPVTKAIEAIKQQTIPSGSLNTSFVRLKGVGPVVLIPGGSLSNNIYGLIVANAGGEDIQVSLRDGNELKIVFNVPANDTRGFMAHPLAAYKQTSGNDWVVSSNRASANVNLTVMWFKGL